MKVLTLQIRKENFDAILSGKQKVEHRDILPKTASRYIKQIDNEDDSVDIEVIEYDALYLINGRKKDAPRLKVEVLESKFLQMVDDNKEPLTYIEDGVEYQVCGMEYKLGKILYTENC